MPLAGLVAGDATGRWSTHRDTLRASSGALRLRVESVTFVSSVNDHEPYALSLTTPGPGFVRKNRERAEAAGKAVR
jgi:hypothetical protein